jgi:hypothetical protein
MMFARYEGVERKGWTYGKTYAAHDAMGDGTGSVSGGVLWAKDDEGNRITLTGNYESSDWRYSQEAYAVVLKPMEEWKVGEVVTVTDWTEDGKIEVKGWGYFDQSYFAVLDRLSVAPNVVICEVANEGFWKRIKLVDEALWVKVGGDGDNDSYRPPDAFLWPVSDDGELMLEPVVTCIAAEGEAGLTMGHRYYLHQTKKDGMVVVKNDRGELEGYMAGRFRMG